MNGIVIVGILLLLIGAFVLVNQGFSYTDRDKVLDIGPIEAHTESRKTVPISPVIGGLALVGGIAMVVLGARKKG